MTAMESVRRGGDGSWRIGQLALVAGLAVAGLEGSAAASGPFIVVLEPDPFLGIVFDHVPFDVRTPPQRIRIRNEGDPTDHDLSYMVALVDIVGSGGGLGTGQEKFWDLACLPTSPGAGMYPGYFMIDVCGVSCEDEWLQSITVRCAPGLLDTPSWDLSLSGGYAYETSRATLPFSNPGPSSITITDLATDSAVFSAALANGTLPLTLAPGQSVDIVASFDGSVPEASGLLDVRSGTTVANRIVLDGLTIPQISPAGWGLSLVPQGAVYTVPLTIRNSFPEARTITAATADVPDYTVSGVVGTTLAPGEVAHGLVTLTATTLGTRVGVVRVAFDRGQGDTARFSADVADPTFSVATDDAIASDGRLDFGTREVGSAPVEQTITISNLDAVARPIFSCEGSGGAFELVGACPTTLPANGSVQLTVRFTPTTLGDALSGAGIAILGMGRIFSALSARVVPAQLAFSATELAFPDLVRGLALPQSLTITNLTADSITLPVTVTGTGFSVAEPRVVIAGGATAEVIVEFRPPAAGLFTGTLELGAAGDLDHAIVSLSGLGWSPDVSVAAALDLGTVTVGATGEAMLELRNLDPVHSVTIAEVVVDSTPHLRASPVDGAGFIAELPGDPVLAPGATLAIVVRFTPVVAGPATATLAIVLDGDPAPQAIVSLTAQGEASADSGGGHHGGGCNAGSSGSAIGGGLAIAVLALLARARRRPWRPRATRAPSAG